MQRLLSLSFCQKRGMLSPGLVGSQKVRPSLIRVPGRGALSGCQGWHSHRAPAHGVQISLPGTKTLGAATASLQALTVPGWDWAGRGDKMPDPSGAVR